MKSILLACLLVIPAVQAFAQPPEEEPTVVVITAFKRKYNFFFCGKLHYLMPNGQEAERDCTSSEYFPALLTGHGVFEIWHATLNPDGLREIEQKFCRSDDSLFPALLDMIPNATPYERGLLCLTSLEMDMTMFDYMSYSGRDVLRFDGEFLKRHVSIANIRSGAKYIEKIIARNGFNQGFDIQVLARTGRLSIAESNAGNMRGDYESVYLLKDPTSFRKDAYVRWNDAARLEIAQTTSENNLDLEIMWRDPNKFLAAAMRGYDDDDKMIYNGHSSRDISLKDNIASFQVFDEFDRGPKTTKWIPAILPPILLSANSYGLLGRHEGGRSPAHLLIVKTAQKTYADFNGQPCEVRNASLLKCPILK